MNNVNLIGRITQDVELRSTESGISCASIFLAINNGKNEKGEERPADFPRIYVYEKQAENLSKYCKKGSLIAVSGRLKTRTWEKEDGSKVYETYVRANNIQFLENKNKESAPLPEPDYSKNIEDNSNSFEDLGAEVSLSDSDLPFYYEI